MAETAAAVFSLVLGFQLIAAYFMIYTSFRTTTTFSRSLQHILAATVFLMAAASVRLAFYGDLLQIATVSTMEAYFYTLAFASLVIPSMHWHTLGKESKTRSLSSSITEFYGEEQ